MRILALVTDAFGAPGGIAQYNRDLLHALGGSEYVESVDILPRQGSAESTLPRGLHQCNPATGKLAYVAKALRLAWRRPYDLVLCGHINLLPLANWIARKLGAPIWLQLHGIDAWRRPRRIRDRHFRRVRLVTVVSRYTRRRFLGWANLSPQVVKVLPNTVGVSAASAPDSDLAIRLGVQDRTVLLTVGRLAASEAYKGHDRVIQCLPELLKKRQDLVYLIAGDGDDRPRLQALAKARGVEDKVIFLGKVTNEELDVLYRLADLFVMPSTGEGFGIVFLEAMARGTPALGLNVDGSVDPLQDGNLGFVAQVGNLCESIVAALNGRPLDNLSERVLDAFSKDKFEKYVNDIVDCSKWRALSK